MRKIYTYRLIKYFPYIRSDEFFNVGVWVWDEQNNKKQLYIDENLNHIKHITKFPSIDKRALLFFLQTIRQEKNPQAWYDNHLRFGDIDSIACEQNIDEVANILYEDYIGYKFHTKIQKDKYEKANEITRMVFKKKFQSKLLLEFCNQYSFNIIHKKTNKKYYGRFGSIGDKTDIQELMYFSLKDNNHTKMKINFLGVTLADKKTIKTNEEIFLKPNHISYQSYLSNENCEEYLENIVST